MASTRKRETKDGRVYYEIRVSRGREMSYLSRRWYPDPSWSRRSIERQLAKVAAEFERQCAAGEIVSHAEARAKRAQILTLRQYGERVFMPAKTVTISENTRASFQGVLDRFVYPVLGELKMEEITPAQISALLLDIQAQGKAHATVVKCYTILRSLFKMAYLGDMIERNPMDKVERPKPRKDEVRTDAVEACTVQEIRQLLEALEQEPLKWQAFVRLLIDTGIRRGECCALRWKDVDFQRDQITISGNLCYTAAKGVYLDTPKNGRHRTIDVDPDVMELLQRLRKQQVLSQFVFTKENSPEPMHPQTPTRYMKKLAARCQIPHLHPHKLRHSFASIAITNGADIASVSEKLGHSDKAVTLRMYTHADEESIKRASSIFREAIKKAGQG